MLSGLQAFYNYSELSEKHRKAAAEYGELKRTLELKTVQENSTSMREVQSMFDRLAKDSPILIASPRRIGKHYTGQHLRGDHQPLWVKQQETLHSNEARNSYIDSEKH